MAIGDKKQIRDGPHPLGLHVASAAQSWLGAAAAFPLFHLGGMQIHPSLKQAADDLRREMAGKDLEKIQLTVMQKAQERLMDTLTGIRNYQHQPYQRQMPPAPLCCTLGSTEVRDYGDNLPDQAPVVIVVPSLVNPAYILDLRQDHSFMRRMAAEGIHPYLIDWAAPGAEELDFNLEDYILKRLLPLIRKIHQRHNRKIHLLGYCMGGNLSLAAAQIMQPEDIIDSLTLMATPWDFHADQPAHLPVLTEYFLKMPAAGQIATSIPMNILHMFFFSLDPTLSGRKFRKFARFNPQDEQTRHFTAIEDWANQGMPLAPKVAQDCLINWYQQNQTQQGCWRIAGQNIDPGLLTLPGHIITPNTDRIVPPASAVALQKKLPHFTHTRAKGGHVTMIAGTTREVTLWHKIISYYK